MYGSAFGWEWFIEIVPYYELFPVIECSEKVYTVQWLHTHVVINRRSNGKSVDSLGSS
jgi:hypothetical protein